MQDLRNIEKKLFGSEQIICSAKQSPKLLFWVIKHLIIYFVVMGLPISIVMILSIIIPALQEFLTKNLYVYFIYSGIAGLWWLILLIKFLINISKLARYELFLTTKRVLILRRGRLTTILLDSITGVTLNANKDVDNPKAVYIEIQTASTIYKFEKMKNGNKLIYMLSNILLGGTIRITQPEETTELVKETPKESANKEEQKPVAPINIKPNVKVDKIPKTEVNATDKLLQKTEAIQSTESQAELNK